MWLSINTALYGEKLINTDYIIMIEFHKNDNEYEIVYTFNNHYDREYFPDEKYFQERWSFLKSILTFWDKIKPKSRIMTIPESIKHIAELEADNGNFSLHDS